MKPWHALLAPLPDDAVVERKPVASAEQLASGTAGPIAGWESLSVNLSDVQFGLRHVLVTLDAAGRVISGGDWVLFQHQERRGEATITVSDHHNIGGRFEDDGSFRGTTWRSRSEQSGDQEEATMIESTPSPPTAEQITALTRLVAEVVRRAPAKTS